MRKAQVIELDIAVRKELEGLSRSRSTSVRLAERSRIVLLAADGLNNQDIGARLHVTRQKAGRWRNRFLEQGIGGIAKDAPRSGRLPSISRRKQARIVKRTLEEKPPNATHWSRSSMAKATGVRVHGRENLAGPWSEAASGTHLQTVQRPPIRRKARGCGRVVSEPAGKRPGPVLRREEPDASPGPHSTRITSEEGAVRARLQTPRNHHAVRRAHTLDGSVIGVACPSIGSGMDSAAEKEANPYCLRQLCHPQTPESRRLAEPQPALPRALHPECVVDEHGRTLFPGSFRNDFGAAFSARFPS